MNKKPLTEADFPYEVQVAFFMLSLLSDRWDGVSGGYFGKDWGPIVSLLDLYEIEDKVLMIELMKMIESINIEFTNDKAQQQRKAAEQAAQKAQNVKKING